MVRINATKSAGLADYFSGGGGDIEYDRDAEAGVWLGRGAEMLGVCGPVGHPEFQRLVGNFHPLTAEQLTPRTKDGRRVAYDITFSVPKGVSLVYALTGDEAILRVFEAAVRGTVGRIEADAQTRVRRDGRDEDRVTGNVVAAMFVHQTTRPVDGIPDPQLHAHCIFFNSTFDPIEKVWKALQLGAVKSDAYYYQAVFHNELARGLESAGYRIGLDGATWDIAAVSKDVRQLFSRRTAQIEQVARDLGIEDPAAKAQLGVITRKAKLIAEGSELASNGEFIRSWEARLTPDQLTAIRTAKREAKAPAPTVSVDEAVAFVSERVFRRSATMSQRAFLAEFYTCFPSKWHEGDVLVAMRRASIAERRSEDLGVLVTHPQAAREEAKLADAVKDGAGRYSRLVPDEGKLPRNLSPYEEGAARSLANSRDLHTVIDGRNGTGTERFEAAASEMLAAAGRPVTTLTPNAPRAVPPRRSKPDRAQPLSDFLESPERLHAARGGVLWVRNFGSMSRDEAARLTDAATRHDCRIIGVGSAEKHIRATSRGNLAEVLRDRAGLVFEHARVATERKKALTQASASVERGQAGRGFDAIAEAGCVTVHPLASLHAKAARDYVDSLERKERVAMVAPSEREVRAANAAVRSELKATGVLGRSREYVQLCRLGLTDDAKMDNANYKRGMFVEFTKNCTSGLDAGSRWKVVGSLGHAVVIRNGARFATVPSERPDRFEVYRADRIAIAPGDRIRLTKTIHGEPSADRSLIHRLLHNRPGTVTKGTEHVVKGFTLRGSVVLANGRIIPRDACHFEHAYCCLTRDAVEKFADKVILVTSRDSRNVSDSAALGAALSVAREEFHIHTDDARLLRNAFVRDEPLRPVAERTEQHGAATMAAANDAANQAANLNAGLAAREAAARTAAERAAVERTAQEQHLREQQQQAMAERNRQANDAPVRERGFDRGGR